MPINTITDKISSENWQSPFLLTELSIIWFFHATLRKPFSFIGILFNDITHTYITHAYTHMNVSNGTHLYSRVCIIRHYISNTPEKKSLILIVDVISRRDISSLSKNYHQFVWTCLISPILPGNTSFLKLCMYN